MAFKMDKGSGPDSDINVTPLIDIVLVLLIIFMVLTPRTIEQMAANLPSKTKQTKKKDEPSKQLIVAAYENGEFALNTKVMELGPLDKELRARLRARETKKRVVFVDAHPNVGYGEVVSVMDMIRDAGASRVGLARLKEEGPTRVTAAAPEGGDEAEATETPQ